MMIEHHTFYQREALWTFHIYTFNLILQSANKNSKYYIPAYLYKECVYYCLQYPEWVKELNSAPKVSAVQYDREKVQAIGLQSN